jgi:hypothetical protein
MTDFGTDPKFLHRSDDPSTSKAAAESVDSNRLEKEVFDYIESCGEYGANANDCIVYLNPVVISSINARPAALYRKGLIYYLGDTRKGATNRQKQVMRANRRKRVLGVHIERRTPTPPRRSKVEQIEYLMGQLEEAHEHIYELEQLIKQGGK